MKKIPTLFVRDFEGHRVIRILGKITPGCEEAFKNGLATIKFDGVCCAIINGVFYKRYDAKKGKKPPEGAIPCCDPDPVTGHWPHWVKVGDGPEDKWFKKAYHNSPEHWSNDGTYEAVGPHFQGNPYNLFNDFLVQHGDVVIEVERTFEGVEKWLKANNEEGIVFWLNGEPVCKIKRTDFGLPWNGKGERK